MRSSRLGIIALICCLGWMAGPAMGQCLRPGQKESVQEDPSSGGPVVIRFDPAVYILTPDDTGLFALYGISDPFEYCLSGDPELISIMDAQWVLTPEQVGSVKDVLRGEDVPTWIWERSVGNGPCAAILNYPPVASGTTRLLSGDNDLLWWTSDNPRSRVWNLMAQGWLSTPEGELVAFSGRTQCVWENDGHCRHCYSSFFRE